MWTKSITTKHTRGGSDPANMSTKDIKGAIRILEHLAMGSDGPVKDRAIERLSLLRAELQNR